MRLVIKNGDVVFRTYQNLYESGVADGLYYNGAVPPVVVSSPYFKLWWYKNISNKDITIRIYNVTGSAYGRMAAIGIFDAIPKEGDVVYENHYVEQLERFDKTITIPSGKVCAISNYSFSDSGDDVPDIQINGENVALPV